MRELARRIEALTPPDRDRAVDALRALAIAGVVLGHWLVTALVVEDGAISDVSPLEHLPLWAPLSWVFQTLAVFFLVGGLVAARGYTRAQAAGIGYGRWLATRLSRLSRPIIAVLVVWAVVTGALLVSNVDSQTVATLVRLVVSPMWFLVVFAVLTAATPLALKVHPAWPLAVVALVDVVRLGAGPDAVGWINVLAGWLVPYSLGAAWARGRLGDRRTLWALVLGGAAGTAALVAWAGYPASMVGVPGEGFSNLNPPSLAAVTFGLAQCGVAGLIMEPLRRALRRRPAAWTAVAVVNLFAMTIFLWHQSAMIAVTSLGLLAGPWFGLHTVPDSATWVLARLAWLPLFALALGICWAAFHPVERATPKATAAPPKATAAPPKATPAPPKAGAAQPKGDAAQPKAGLALSKVDSATPKVGAVPQPRGSEPGPASRPRPNQPTVTIAGSS